MKNSELLLSDINAEILYSEPMAKHTSYKIGGPADIFIIPENFASLKDILKRLDDEGIEPFVLGGGTNLLVGDNGIRGVVIKISEVLSEYNIDKNNVWCSSGKKLMNLIKDLSEAGLSGLEWASGIPGTVGGGVYMNAGAYGSTICDSIINVEVINWKGKEEVIEKKNLKCEYRLSGLEDTGVIKSVLLKLSRDESEKIKDRIKDILLKRETKQPLNYPSAGSVFKNPREDIRSGELIDLAGLKGARFGDAQVSEKHANFIVNLGNATCKDVLNLIDFVQNKIYSLYGISLETEIKVVGDLNEK